MLEVRRLLQSWLDAGVDRAASDRRQRQTRNANLVALTFAAVSLPYVPLEYYLGAPHLAAVTLVSVGLHLLTLPLNARGHSRSARALPLVVGSLMAWLVTLVLTPESQVQLLLFMVGLWAFVLFDARSEWPLLVGLQVLPAAIHTSVNWGFVPRVSDFVPSANLVRAYSALTPATTFLLSSGLLFAFHRRNQKTEDQLLATVKHLEAAHRAAKAGESAKAQFLAVMSHELRTPLNGVLGSAELLGTQPLSPEQRHWLRTLTSSAECLLDLMTNILDYASLDADRFEVQESAVDVRRLVEDTVEAFAKSAEAKGLDIWLRSSPSVPSTVMLDPGRLRVVVAALVSNALKYCQRGHVEVCLGFSAESPMKGVVELEVIDTGIGVAPEMRERIFEAFSQGHSFEKRNEGGIGMGLSLSQASLRAMGGSISFDSIVGHGSNFSVRLPVSLSPVVASPSTTPGPPSTVTRKSVRILVENEPLRLALADILGKWGHPIVDSESKTAAEVLLLDSRVCSDAEVMTKLTRGNEQIIVLGALPDGKPCGAASCGRFLRHDEWYHALERSFAVSGTMARPSYLPKSHRSDAQADSQPLIDKLMIADDQLTNRTILKKLAERFARQVILVENGKLAVEAWQRETPEVILMDIQMPVMDGVEATRRIRELEDGANRPVIIAVTANALPEQRLFGIAAGLDEYLTKPVRVTDLRDAIRRLTRKSRGPAISPRVRVGESS